MAQTGHFLVAVSRSLHLSFWFTVSCPCFGNSCVSPVFYQSTRAVFPEVRLGIKHAVSIMGALCLGILLPHWNNQTKNVVLGLVGMDLLEFKCSIDVPVWWDEDSASVTFPMCGTALPWKKHS